MRRNTMKYGIGLAVALLATACSNEIIEPDGGTDLPDMQEGLGKIVITLPAEEAATRAEGDENKPSHIHGEVNVDKGKVLIFSTNRDQYSDFMFEQEIDVTFASKTFDGNVTFKEDDCETDGNTRMTAETTFSPEAGKLYRIYAYAYNSGSIELTCDAKDKYLQYKDINLSATQLASVKLSPVVDGETTEVYGGWIYEYTNQPYPISGGIPSSTPVLNQQNKSEVKNYGGSLKRQTGRLEVHIDLSEFGPNSAEQDEINQIKSASLIVEKYHNQMPIDMQIIKSGETTGYYYNPFDTQKEVVATDENVADGSLDFVADIIPIYNSNVFVEIENTDGSTTMHQIRVADDLVDGVSIGISVWIAKDNQLSLFPNFWTVLKATYRQLSKNWTIDFDWGINGEDEYVYSEELNK